MDMQYKSREQVQHFFTTVVAKPYHRLNFAGIAKH